MVRLMPPENGVAVPLSQIARLNYESTVQLQQYGLAEHPFDRLPAEFIATFGLIASAHSCTWGNSLSVSSMKRVVCCCGVVLAIGR